MLAVLEEARKKIEKKGFATLTAERHSGNGQICAHTVGFPAMGLPDLMVMVPDGGEDLAGVLLNEVGALQVAQGKLTHGRVLTKELFPDLSDDSYVKMVMCEITDEQGLDIFVMNKVLLRDKPYTQEAFQIVYPDDKGRMPWQTNSNLANLRMFGRRPE